jgi:RNA polymerase-binding transcription factor DksA
MTDNDRLARFRAEYAALAGAMSPLLHATKRVQDGDRLGTCARCGDRIAAVRRWRLLTAACCASRPRVDPSFANAVSAQPSSLANVQLV